ncbi:MAG: RNA polymerase sigma factor [Deltaproteobacteria bacterium]|nr:RNA polymerase sigma factor [Deltaproteobacteria bacterium]
MQEKCIVFSDIYDQYYLKIQNYLNRLVGDQEAEEVTQIVFVKISQKLDSFKEKSKLSTWLYRIATNAGLDKLRSSSYKYSSTGPIAPFPIHTAETEHAIFENTNNKHSLDSKLIKSEMNECIREFVDKLPSDYRAIIVLSEFEGFTNKEIADILQISIATAKIRLHRARTELKKSLENGCDFYFDEHNEFACDRKH